jgi:2-succinyl-6-hydroxy-2,4-cyclohexadiene-1-carboxylate synthase
VTGVRARLHADTIGPAEADRLVLVHGFTQTNRCWGSFADDLARDHELVLVDAPGHGGSAMVAADLPATADLLSEVGGPATYVGYSMGGRMALHLALQHPGQVARLVLVGTTAGIIDDAERAARRSADEQLADHLEAIGVEKFVDEWLTQPMFAGLTRDAAAVPERLRNSPDGLASSLRLAGTGTQQPLWDRLGDLAMPVLVMAGVDDAKFSAVASRLGHAIGPNASVALVPRAGHSAPFENPADAASIVRRWLRAHPT